MEAACLFTVSVFFLFIFLFCLFSFFSLFLLTVEELQFFTSTKLEEVGANKRDTSYLKRGSKQLY